jgi:tRNA A37 methylthiotransferase MiaB/very-short-patch-repair endonuclease
MPPQKGGIFYYYRTFAPTESEIMADILQKEVDEQRQGEAFAPFVEDVNIYKKKFYIESYGCAMNFSDSEVVASILHEQGYGATRNFEEANLILINTCSIREKAEQTVRNRLVAFRKVKKRNPGMLVGVLGCMAERLKAKLLEEEKLVDMVIGPDAYRTIPGLIEEAEGGQRGVNVLLSRDETYADISPVRLDSNGVTSFVSIMRGCNNMCTFCVVPFTRGRERSRDAESIYNECVDLFERGYKEITLLGQNVDSYHYSPSLTLPQGEGTEPHTDGKRNFNYATADTLLYGLLKDFALQNRNNPTKAESILWDNLRGKKLENYKFRRQHIISSYIADFVCLEKHLIIEVDGPIHQIPQNAESDIQRSAQLLKLGFTVLRFTNDEIFNDLETVLNKILEALKSAIDKPLWFNLPKASPAGGGLEGAITFAKLLEMVALISPLLRVRFSTSHPKDITDDVLYTMAKYHNICKYIHLPVQSGNTRILQHMNRTYTREWYLSKVKRIREIMPECGISTDIITGFCSETEEEHQDTLSIIELSRFDMSYMYSYSERPGTLAARRYEDDVPEEVKKRRLEEIIEVQHKVQRVGYLNDIGNTFEVLIENSSKRSENDWSGRSSQNKMVVFPKGNHNLKIGNYAMVKIHSCTSATLIGEIVG